MADGKQTRNDRIEQYKPPFSRGHIAAALEAKIAASRGQTREEYLRYRLASYLKKAPQDMVLPVRPVFTDDGFEFEHNPEWDNDPIRRALEDPAGEDLLMHAGAAERRWLSQEAQTEARQMLRDIADAEQESSEAEHGMRQAAETVNDSKASLVSGIADGSIVPEATLVQRLARCPYQPANITGLIVAAVLVGLIVAIIEGVQLGVTFADGMGVDTSSLWTQFKKAPLNVVIAFLLGFGASFSILAAAHIGLSKAHEALYGEIPVRRRVIDALVGIVFLGFVTIVLYQVSMGRHTISAGADALRAAGTGQATAGGGMGTWAFFWIAFCLTIGAAMVTHIAHLRLRQRKDDEKGRQAWIADKNSEMESRERAEELVANLEAERLKLERRRDEARERLRTLNLKAQEVEARLRKEFERKAKWSRAFAHALEAGLRKDLHYFNLFTKKKGKQDSVGSGDKVPASTVGSNSQPPTWEQTEVPQTFHSTTIKPEVHS